MPCTSGDRGRAPTPDERLAGGGGRSGCCGGRRWASVRCSFEKVARVKLVAAVVRPHALGAVQQALKDLGVGGMSVSEVSGFGHQGGHVEVYRGAEYAIDFVPKAKIEVVVADEDVSEVVSAIAAVAGSGRIGDGKIWVVPVVDVTRVRTGEHGYDAL